MLTQAHPRDDDDDDVEELNHPFCLAFYQTTQNMYAGVLRDEARQAAKKAEREREFQEQIRRRMYLESQQKVSNPADGSSSSSAAYDAALQKDLKPMDVVEFQGCKTC